MANQFITLRGIPPINVFYIDWDGSFDGIDGETFRQKILDPAVTAMERRGIYRQIDYVIYSSDFPYSVGLAKDFKDKVKFPDQATPVCSINSATYLWHMVMLKLPRMMSFDVNQYLRSSSTRRSTSSGGPKRLRTGFAAGTAGGAAAKFAKPAGSPICSRPCWP